ENIFTQSTSLVSSGPETLKSTSDSSKAQPTSTRNSGEATSLSCSISTVHVIDSRLRASYVRWPMRQRTGDCPQQSSWNSQCPCSTAIISGHFSVKLSRQRTMVTAPISTFASAATKVCGTSTVPVASRRSAASERSMSARPEREGSLQQWTWSNEPSWMTPTRSSSYLV